MRGSTTAVCSVCGSHIPAGSPGAQCPACLARLALAGAAAQFPQALPSEEIDGWFSDLEVTQLLGCGGMGAVYRAHQRNLDRTVALKVIPFERGDDATLARFMREAQMMARLRHPRIVTIFEIRQLDDYLCLLMEYMEGGNLRERMCDGALPAESVLRLGEQICAGLDYAHAEQVVHRDIKPENVLLDAAGNAKIADFGLAKLMEQEVQALARLTRSGQLIGSANYLAPEQFQDTARVDPRCDLYALGVILYELLTGRLPAVDYVPPSRVRKLDRRFDPLVQRLLRRDPQARYARAADVRRDLLAITYTRDRRRPLLITAALAGGLMLLATLRFVPWPVTPVASTEATKPPKLSEIHGSLSRSYIDLKDPTATYEFVEPGYSIGHTINGVSHADGWSLRGQESRDQAAVFPAVAPFDAEQLLFDIRNDGGGLPGHKPQRFRISYTTSPQPTVGDTSIEWVLLKPSEVTTTLEESRAVIEDDGSTVHVMGKEKVPDDYAVFVEGKFRGITGFKLDLLRGENGLLGFSGPAGGNVHISEFEVLAFPSPQRTRPARVELSHATATYSQTGQTPGAVEELIDGNERGASYWEVSHGAQVQDQAAVVCPTQPLTAGGLTFELMHNSEEWFHKMHHFRLSYTQDPNPTATDSRIRWTPIVPTNVRFTPPGMKASWDSQGLIAVSEGAAVAQCNYLVEATQRFERVTGFRLDVYVAGQGKLGMADDGRMKISEWHIMTAEPRP